MQVALDSNDQGRGPHADVAIQRDARVSDARLIHASIEVKAVEQEGRIGRVGDELPQAVGVIAQAQVKVEVEATREEDGKWAELRPAAALKLALTDA